MTLSVDQIIKSIEKLPAAEPEKIRQWLEDIRKRGTEKETAHKNTLIVRQSPQMVARKPRQIFGAMGRLDGDRLIASGPTAKEVYSKARAEGVKIPLVELIRDREPVLLTGGWLS